MYVETRISNEPRLKISAKVFSFSWSLNWTLIWANAVADAEFSSLGNADSSNVKGPSDMIYIKWSILFFVFSSSPLPQVHRGRPRRWENAALVWLDTIRTAKNFLTKHNVSLVERNKRSAGPRLIVPYKSLYFVGEMALLIKRLIFLFLLHSCHVGMWKPRLLNRTQCEFHPSEQCCSGIFLALKCLKIKHNAVFFHRQEDLNKIQMN